ncbi:MAG TPA: MmgE/PrpD family protein [Stellaceae bacterium]|nr:MmgE/PrpD family protein [Stellaceae bacterium]
MTPTRALARYVVQSRWEELPPPVRHETVRALVNWIGCPIWGSRDAAVARTLAALDPFSGPREAAVLGRAERLDPFKAALVNGVAAAIADYDDTHLETVIHPTGPAACVLLALAERHRMSGAAFLHALALGIEVQCRVARALAVAPARMNGGWYLTGLTGGIGAAVAAGRVLGLDETRMLWAIGIAAARAAGARETHGTMAKNLVAAFAAEDGLMAAFLAQQGMEAPETPIEGRRGLGSLVSDGADFTAMTAGLGQDFELMRNAYKPFPSGIVIHAAITGALELARAHAPDPGSITAVRLTVHPLCLELCGRRTPRTAVEGTFSVYHWVAVALTEREIGIRHFSDAMVNDPAIIALRDRIEARSDPGFRKDEAAITVVLGDGTVCDHHVDHALGAIERPPSDAELGAKLADLVGGILSPARAAELAAACWGLADAPDAGVILRESTLGRS